MQTDSAAHSININASVLLRHAEPFHRHVFVMQLPLLKVIFLRLLVDDIEQWQSAEIASKRRADCLVCERGFLFTNLNRTFTSRTSSSFGQELVLTAFIERHEPEDCLEGKINT